LTNLAVALSLEPRIVEWVDRLVIMGGAFSVRGNTTPHAEFNIYADPEAAAKVARATFRAEWVSLDATHETGLTREQWDRLAEADDPGLILVREVTRRSLTELNRPRFYLHDPLAVAVAENQSSVVMRVGTVTVDVGEFERGKTRLAEPVGDESSVAASRHVNADVFGSVLARLIPLDQ
jgi:inosine-uridine nucleoside N-ribohydrolase